MTKVTPKKRTGKLTSELEALVAEQAKDRGVTLRRAERSLDKVTKGRALHEAIDAAAVPAPSVRRVNANDLPRGMGFHEGRGRLYQHPKPPRGIAAMAAAEDRFRSLARRVAARLLELSPDPRRGAVVPSRPGHLEALEALDRAINNEWRTSLLFSFRRVAQRRKEHDLRNARRSRSFSEDLEPPESAEKIFDRVRSCNGCPTTLTVKIVAAVLPGLRLGRGGPGGGWDAATAVALVELAMSDPKGFAAQLAQRDTAKKRRAIRQKR
jgi:hypothetical protein